MDKVQKINEKIMILVYYCSMGFFNFVHNDIYICIGRILC